MTTGSHADRLHALCSASGAERWLNCPGSVSLSRAIPEEPPSAASREGTRAHELAERILRQWEKDGRRLDMGWIEGLRPEYEDTVKDGWSMLDYAMTYVNLCIDEVENFDPGTDVSVRLEQRIVFNADMAMFGTVDFFATGTRGGVAYGVIVDFKYGKKKIPVENNPQLAYYAVALKRGSKKKLEKVKVRVVQPRVTAFFADVEYDQAGLQEWNKRLTLGAERALLQINAKKPELKGGAWCWFCPARNVCPEKAREASVRAADDF